MSWTIWLTARTSQIKRSAINNVTPIICQHKSNAALRRFGVYWMQINYFCEIFVITLNGSTQRQFAFPDTLAAATRYYRNFDAIFDFLPHISLVQKYGPNRYRALYHTIELGVYRVKIYCDLQIHFDEAHQTLSVSPFSGPTPVKQSVSVQALVAQGQFSSQSVFVARGDETQIDYRLKLTAALPKPFGLSLVPDNVMNQITHSIADWRIHEIAGGFIDRSIAAYRLAQPARHESCPAALPRPVALAPADLKIEHYRNK